MNNENNTSEGTDSSLLYSNSEQKFNKESDQVQTKRAVRKVSGIFFLVVALIIGAGIAIAYMVGQSYIPQDAIDTFSLEAAQAKLDAAYASEGAFPAPEGVDSMNYGLDEVPADLPAPSGTIVFTGRNADTSSYMNTYYWDVTSDTDFVPSYFLKNNMFLFGTFDNKEYPLQMYLNTVTNASAQSEKSILGLHRFNIADDSYTYLRSADHESEAREIEVAPDRSKLAFSRLKFLPKTLADMPHIDDWEVVVIDPNSDELLLTIDGATNPKWSPDGNKIVFLKSRGLFVYDMETGVQTPILQVADGQVISTSMIDITSSGDYLALTNSQTGLITMYSISSWSEFQMEEIGRITIPGTNVLWPQFSPDGNYYAVQVIDVAQEGGERTNSRFEVRPTLGREVVAEHSTDAFKFTEFHTNDWVASNPEVVAEE